MSIESESQKDLSLNAEDAENVTGGLRKKKAARKAAKHHATASSLIVVNMPPSGGSADVPEENIDGSAPDVAAVSGSDEG